MQRFGLLIHSVVPVDHLPIRLAEASHGDVKQKPISVAERSGQIGRPWNTSNERNCFGVCAESSHGPSMRRVKDRRIKRRDEPFSMVKKLVLAKDSVTRENFSGTFGDVAGAARYA